MTWSDVVKAELRSEAAIGGWPLPVLFLLGLIVLSCVTVQEKPPVVIPSDERILRAPASCAPGDGWYLISGGHLMRLYEENVRMAAELTSCKTTKP